MVAEETWEKLVRFVATQRRYCSRAGSGARGQVRVLSAFSTVRFNCVGGGGSAANTVTQRKAVSATTEVLRIRVRIKKQCSGYNMNESTRLTSELSVTAPDSVPQAKVTKIRARPNCGRPRVCPLG